MGENSKRLDFKSNWFKKPVRFFQNNKINNTHSFYSPSLEEYIQVNDNEFQLFVGEKRILEHSKERPMIYVGVGQEDVDMYRGNFKITDYVTERFPLKLTDVIQTADTVRLCFESYIIAKIKCDENLCTIDFEQKDDRINRFWFRVAADKEEKCYGCGEQMSYFNLRGRNFPIWTSEPGVGRDKTTYVTWRSDVENKAGGNYYNTMGSRLDGNFVKALCESISMGRTSYTEAYRLTNTSRKTFSEVAQHFGGMEW